MAALDAMRPDAVQPEWRTAARSSAALGALLVALGEVATSTVDWTGVRDTSGLLDAAGAVLPENTPFFVGGFVNATAVPAVEGADVWSVYRPAGSLGDCADAHCRVALATALAALGTLPEGAPAFAAGMATFRSAVAQCTCAGEFTELDSLSASWVARLPQSLVGAWMDQEDAAPQTGVADSAALTHAAMAAAASDAAGWWQTGMPPTLPAARQAAVALAAELQVSIDATAVAGEAVASLTEALVAAGGVTGDKSDAIAAAAALVDEAAAPLTAVLVEGGEAWAAAVADATALDVGASGAAALCSATLEGLRGTSAVPDDAVSALRYELGQCLAAEEHWARVSALSAANDVILGLLAAEYDGLETAVVDAFPEEGATLGALAVAAQRLTLDASAVAQTSSVLASAQADLALANAALELSATLTAELEAATLGGVEGSGQASALLVAATGAAAHFSASQGARLLQTAAPIRTLPSAELLALTAACTDVGACNALCGQRFAIQPTLTAPGPDPATFVTYTGEAETCLADVPGAEPAQRDAVAAQRTAGVAADRYAQVQAMRDTVAGILPASFTLGMVGVATAEGASACSIAAAAGAHLVTTATIVTAGAIEAAAAAVTPAGVPDVPPAVLFALGGDAADATAWTSEATGDALATWLGAVLDSRETTGSDELGADALAEAASALPRMLPACEDEHAALGAVLLHRMAAAEPLGAVHGMEGMALPPADALTELTAQALAASAAGNEALAAPFVALGEANTAGDVATAAWSLPFLTLGQLAIMAAGTADVDAVRLSAAASAAASLVAALPDAELPLAALPSSAARLALQGITDMDSSLSGVVDIVTEAPAGTEALEALQGELRAVTLALARELVGRQATVWSENAAAAGRAADVLVALQGITDTSISPLASFAALRSATEAVQAAAAAEAGVAVDGLQGLLADPDASQAALITVADSLVASEELASSLSEDDAAAVAALAVPLTTLQEVLFGEDAVEGEQLPSLPAAAAAAALRSTLLATFSAVTTAAPSLQAPVDELAVALLTGVAAKPADVSAATLVDADALAEAYARLGQLSQMAAAGAPASEQLALARDEVDALVAAAGDSILSVKDRVVAAAEDVLDRVVANIPTPAPLLAIVDVVLSLEPSLITAADTLEVLLEPVVTTLKGWITSVQSVSDRVGSAMERLQTRMNAYIDIARSVFDVLTDSDKIVEFITAEVEPRVADLIQRARDLVDNVVEDLRETLVNLANRLVDKVQDIVDIGVQKISNASIVILDKVDAFTRDSPFLQKADEIIEVVANVTETLIGKAAPIVEVVLQVGQTTRAMGQTTPGPVGKLMRDGGGGLVYIATQAKKILSFASQIQKLAAKIVDNGGIMETLRVVVQNLIDRLGELASSWVEQLRTWAVRFANFVPDTILNLLDKGQAFLNELFSKFLSFVLNKLSGVFDFIANMARKVEGVVDTAQAAADFLDVRFTIADILGDIVTIMEAVKAVPLQIRDAVGTALTLFDTARNARIVLADTETHKEQLQLLKERLPALVGSLDLQVCVSGTVCIKKLLQLTLDNFLDETTALGAGIQGVLAFVQEVKTSGKALVSSVRNVWDSLVQSGQDIVTNVQLLFNPGAGTRRLMTALDAAPPASRALAPLPRRTSLRSFLASVSGFALKFANFVVDAVTLARDIIHRVSSFLSPISRGIRTVVQFLVDFNPGKWIAARLEELAHFLLTPVRIALKAFITFRTVVIDKLNAVVEFAKTLGRQLALLARDKFLRIPKFALTVLQGAASVLDFIRPFRDTLENVVDKVDEFSNKARDLLGRGTPNGVVDPSTLEPPCDPGVPCLHVVPRRSSIYQGFMALKYTHFWYQNFPPAFGSCQIFGYPCRGDKWTFTVPGLFEDWLPQALRRSATGGSS
ncbi:hypothetical protein BU14_0797s0001 [Porphyra umbilicalis]|uniref:Uncharacterized protein n=1 Tax=Porphyra umbilicalis TaxID=2786 RepID=A0A1X6NNT0_PORUM|nr:hypothetical protein BU14_0797s0001 [Porphyra umbilicalis]|eukprot:OSX70309.1 hypothetical protein BU14_0797s0001 [Porphyra umbilicalis]